MSRPAPPLVTESADAAINAVLNAEQRARQSIEAAQTEAHRLVETARLRARHLHERTDQRAAKLRAACQRWTAVRTAELKAEAEAARQCPVTDDARYRRLQAAVRQLAAELTRGGT
jgi:vacuolar-type H+-ATPase subunit H